ncbi:MAG: hypothetical protein AABW53_00770 [Nanoarchaeota archaeon]
MSVPKILTFTGASGSGKSTLVKFLLEETGYKLIISSTTRQPRGSDLPGEYEFLGAAEFTAGAGPARDEKRSGDFLWIKEYAGNYYGTRKGVVDEALRSPDVYMMILVPEVLPYLLDYAGKDKVLPVYIRSPPESILQTRLEKRGETLETIEKRIKESRNWDKRAERSDIPYVFITNNGTIDEMVEQVRKCLGTI